MTMTQLRTLDALLRQGTFGGAAEALGVSQGAISQQLASLETAVGRKLFARAPGRGPVIALPAAQAVAGRVRKVLAGVRAIEAALAAPGPTDPRPSASALPAKRRIA